MEALLFLTLTAVPWAEIGSLLTALAVLATAYLAQKARRGIADKQEVKTEQIHVLVNSRLTQALNRIAELERLLRIGPTDPVPTPDVVEKKVE